MKKPELRVVKLNDDQISELISMLDEGIKNFESVAERTRRSSWKEKAESLRDIKSALQGK